MKKHIAIMLLGAVAAWTGAMLLHAGASEHWKIVVNIHGNDAGQNGSLTYGKQETGPHYFPSEAACKTAITDPKDDFAEVWARVQAKAKELSIKVDEPTCALDLKKDET